MGNGQSIFYPDNGNRYDRAQQLGNDCKLFQSEFESKKAQLEKELGPYKEKVDKVLLAFGCNDLDDLSRLIEKSGSGQALEDWQKIKNVYDKTQIVDQVIYGAMGIVAVVGLAVSAIGAFFGGIGFFAGIGITSDITLILGVIGLIFDAINGAIQRAKLREAITSLFTSRIKIKRVLAHLDNLVVWLPAIKEIYQTFEDLGYDKEKIIEVLKRKGFDGPIKSDMENETYYKAASDLHELDSGRKSWTNEDPNWESTGRQLDILEQMQGVIIGRKQTGAKEVIHASKSVSLHKSSASPAHAHNLEEFSSLHLITIDNREEPPPPYDNRISITINPPPSPDLSGILKMHLIGVMNEKTAVVVLRQATDQLGGFDAKAENEFEGDHDQSKEWALTLAGEVDLGEGKRIDVRSASFPIILSRPGAQPQYLGENGQFRTERSEAAVFVASYAYE